MVPREPSRREKKRQKREKVASVLIPTCVILISSMGIHSVLAIGSQRRDDLSTMLYLRVLQLSCPSQMWAGTPDIGNMTAWHDFFLTFWGENNLDLSLLGGLGYPFVRPAKGSEHRQDPVDRSYRHFISFGAISLFLVIPQTPQYFRVPSPVELYHRAQQLCLQMTLSSS